MTNATLCPDLAESPAVLAAEYVAKALRGKRMRCSTEAALQADIALVLSSEHIGHEREVWLGSETGRIDFRIGRIGLEVKVGGGARDIHRQVARYCAHPGLDAVILATTRAVSLPAMAKPVLILDLSRAWL